MILAFQFNNSSDSSFNIETIVIRTTYLSNVYLYCKTMLFQLVTKTLVEQLGQVAI